MGISEDFEARTSTTNHTGISRENTDASFVSGLTDWLISCHAADTGVVQNDVET